MKYQALINELKQVRDELESIQDEWFESEPTGEAISISMAKVATMKAICCLEAVKAFQKLQLVE